MLETQGGETRASAGRDPISDRVSRLPLVGNDLICSMDHWCS